MAKYEVTTPAPGHTGPLGGIHFVDGSAVVDEDAHPAELRYCRAQGYGVELIEEPAPESKAPAKAPRKPAAKTTTAKTPDDTSGGDEEGAGE